MNTFQLKAISLLGACIMMGSGLAASQTSANTGGEGINQVDENGKRQGFWRIVGPVKGKPEYNGKLYEEGTYVDGRKNGVWKRFWPNGKVLSEIEYHQNRPQGEYRIYQQDGSLEEDGNWQYNTNTGDFKRYHENGNLAQDFQFDNNGIRQGQQKYYHENGNLAVDVDIKNGKEQGTLKRYHTNGELKAEVVYNDGQVDQNSSRWLNPKKALPVADKAPEKVAPKVASTEKVNEATQFVQNGHNTLYNRNRQITQVGVFKNGKLYNGKIYKRTTNGILSKIEIYKKGVYIGDGVITSDDY